jgi:serine/threonine-protein kinase ULK2
MRNAPVKRDDTLRYQLSPIKLEQQIKNYSYFLTDVLGKGYSSVVYKGHNRQNGSEVAIKIVDLQKIDTPVKKSLLFNEARIVCCLNHPNLLKSQEVFHTKGHTFLVSEYCDEGDLSRILKTKRKLPPLDAFQIFHQLLLGLKGLR